jgi:hypothetical protein
MYMFAWVCLEWRAEEEGLLHEEIDGAAFQRNECLQVVVRVVERQLPRAQLQDELAASEGKKRERGRRTGGGGRGTFLFFFMTSPRFFASDESYPHVNSRKMIAGRSIRTRAATRGSMACPCVCA